jgi:ABC-type glycerol-3-phosphate transport system substrate-binding protein
MVPLPRDAQAFTQASISGYAISAHALAPDACWEWIAFLTSQTSAGAIPVRRSVLESEAYEQRVGGEAVDVAIASLENAEIISYWTLFSGFRYEMGIFERAVQRILRAESTAQEAMDWAQSTVAK